LVDRLGFASAVSLAGRAARVRGVGSAFVVEVEVGFKLGVGIDQRASFSEAALGVW
jgi:hypothetical protein